MEWLILIVVGFLLRDICSRLANAWRDDRQRRRRTPEVIDLATARCRSRSLRGRR